MSEVATVSAGDIARLGGVSRAAVSNWRRRHPDFPSPVDGTPASPRYELRHVEEWLRRNGKATEMPPLERMWQHLRGEGGEIGLGHVVARAGALLVWLRDGDDEPLLPGVTERTDAAFVELAERVADEHGHAGAFELLHARYLETDSRRLRPTPPDVVAAMLELAAPEPGELLLDPACGTGGLLVAARADRLRGVDLAPDRALIAAARLRLARREAASVCADALLPPDPADLADVVVCDPPVGDRRDLDGPWPYGVPPRSEPELAWAQRCVQRVRPGGRVVVRMPAAAASRRRGRRVRAALLHDGALRAVVGAGHDADLWVLRRPRAGDRRPTTILLAPDTHRPADERPLAAVDAETVDLSPRLPPRPDPAAYAAKAQALAEVRPCPPALQPTTRELPTTSLAALERAGVVRLVRVSTADPAPATLTADDLRLARAPSGPGSGSTVVRAVAGDVVVGAACARTLDAPAALAPGLTAYRPDVDRIDPELLAGVLRTAGTSRAEQRRVRVPDLPLDEQRPLAAALRRLADLHLQLQQAAAAAEVLAAQGTAGLLAGRLAPGDPQVRAPGVDGTATLSPRPGGPGRTPS
ncbi:N-6 DNA methylase [Pseudonocardia benzenivorans]|uniref:N-6 DNA methylase n=2 Tax=Pseudonocardia TaxID=1847 RepID=F4CJT2_PSEUX|nr:N-6 DNA methylase [Pseudonocardia dioxanivorans]AEA26957.1 N-6 DNA methylase [Pseudonocardia dioxanivorans CB1190]